VRPGRAADHSPPSSAVVMEEWCHTSTYPLGHTGPVTRNLYLYPFYFSCQVSFSVHMLHGTRLGEKKSNFSEQCSFQVPLIEVC